MVTGRQNRAEELLMFGCQALTVLFEKLQTLAVDGSSPDSGVSEAVLSRVFPMFLRMESRKVRQ
jgi:hypothetical protein